MMHSSFFAFIIYNWHESYTKWAEYYDKNNPNFKGFCPDGTLPFGGCSGGVCTKDKCQNLGTSASRGRGLSGKGAQGGAGGNNAQNMVDTQQDIVDSLYAQIKSNNSVDLNEELVDLVKYQTAYAAAAQVFNVVNNCLDTLMTLGR